MRYTTRMQHPQNTDGVSVHTGFPNPATDTSLRSLDLNQLLINHSASTYLFRVRGSEWQDSGVYDGDIAIVDRALRPRPDDVIIWWNSDAEQFSISLQKKAPADAELWGVITATIHQFRKKRFTSER